MRNYVLTGLLIVLSSVSPAFGQTPANTTITAEMRQAANGFFQNQDWKNAAAAYAVIVQAEEKNAGARFRYGVALLGLDKVTEAQPHLENAVANTPNPLAAFHLARVYARQNQTDKALTALDKMVSLGGVPPATLTGEKDFAALQTDARFQAIVKKSDIATNPCKASPEFRQFDFWLGEWEARTPQGNIGGTSSVQLILGSCIIFENWTGASGVSGKSFNIYDTNDKKWHQTWVDDKGTFTHYIGGLQDGKMVIVAETVVSGKKTLAKMTFSKLPNGDVRQFGENSTDEGKTWVVAFDLIYSKKR